MIDYIKDKELVNEYAFVKEPTAEEIKELQDNGFTFFSRVQDPETYEWSEMWIK